MHETVSGPVKWVHNPFFPVPVEVECERFYIKHSTHSFISWFRSQSRKQPVWIDHKTMYKRKVCVMYLMDFSLFNSNSHKFHSFHICNDTFKRGNTINNTQNILKPWFYCWLWWLWASATAHMPVRGWASEGTSRFWQVIFEQWRHNKSTTNLQRQSSLSVLKFKLNLSN